MQLEQPKGNGKTRSIWATAIAVLLAIGFFQGAGHAQPSSPPAGERGLVVAIKEAPPFVIKHDDGTYHGIGIDLWRRVADRLKLHYGFLERPTAEALLKGTSEGLYDAAFGALDVTAARQRLVDFTQPFYATGLGIAVSANENKLLTVSRILFSRDFLQAVLVLIGIALGVG